MLRATLKSLFSRKLRLLLSGVAVILAVMFVSAAFVLSDTLGRTFSALFTTVADSTDVQVQAHVDDDEAGVAVPGTLTADIVRRIAAAPGVADATGKVRTDGARAVGHDGKVVAGAIGAAQVGADWPGQDTLLTLRAGRAPAQPDEIVVNAGLAKVGEFKLGERIGVLTLQPKKMFTIVGIAEYAGGRDSIGGERTVYFTGGVAQELLLGTPGAYNLIEVRAAVGVDPTTVRDTLRVTMGAGYDVRTGQEIARKNSESVEKNMAFVTYILLGFAAVALLVGVFLILNTFSIIVAQRSRELAVLRALGASRRQLVGSVLVEALVIGVLSWLLGLSLGVGVGWAGAQALTRLNGDLEPAAVAVPLSAWIASFAVGVGVTVLAALLPAAHVARIAPVAALRQAAATDRPLTRLTLGGGVLLVAGGGSLAYGLSGRASGLTLTMVLAGVLLCLIAVALLTPFMGRPVVSVIGRAFAWSVPGQLGRRNSARNPRRTAITASAMMISVALVAAISTVLTSASHSFGALADKQVNAELIIAGQQTGPVPPAIDTAALSRIRAMPMVESVSGMSADFASVNGVQQVVGSYDDLDATLRILRVRTVSGTLGQLAGGQVLVDDATARAKSWKVGDRLVIRLPRGQERQFELVGIYARVDVINGVLVSWRDATTEFRFATATQAYVKLRDPAGVAGVKAEINGLLADSPEVNVLTRAEWVGDITSMFDVVLLIVQVLLGVAMLIAVLGIVNTLVLSTLERTRELGLLRAIGMRRAQLIRMVTVESVVISLFGALLGVTVGAALGAAVVRALRDKGFTELALPWELMWTYLIAAGAVGVVAAVIPAVRAARLNVLNAIAHD